MSRVMLMGALVLCAVLAILVFTPFVFEVSTATREIIGAVAATTFVAGLIGALFLKS